MALGDIVPLDKIWLNGNLVPWKDATVHLIAHVMHYGYGAFEGIRSYKTTDGRSAVFKLDAHIRRLFDSMKILDVPMTRTHDELVKATLDTIRANKLDESYLRPMAYVGEGALGFGAMTNPTNVAVLMWEWGAYLGAEGLANGIRCKISSFPRHHVGIGMVKAKVIGQYVNAILAKREVTKLGFDEAILLDVDGYVTEASGQNLFIARDNVVKTAPLSSSILPGITRDVVIQLCKEAGYSVLEERFTRDEMYVADEVFLTGTASEVAPVREVDQRPIGTGKAGPIAKKLQEMYTACVRGDSAKHREWLTYV
ncbi:MAG TPA: branched-chain amino acid transaminase [Kofleriaceae bacterium]|jgi:branched-chain amino acid aminotransferase